MQVILHSKATNYRALLRKITYKDKASYGSWPPCNVSCTVCAQKYRCNVPSYVQTQNILMWYFETECTRTNTYVKYSIVCLWLSNRLTHNVRENCNTLQHTATHCSTLQHAATHCNTQQPIMCICLSNRLKHNVRENCNTLQHTTYYASRWTCQTGRK